MRHLDLEVAVAGRWTPKDVKAVSVARIVAGDDVCEIARDAGVASQTVYEWGHASRRTPTEEGVGAAAN